MTANDQAAKDAKPMTKSEFVRQFPNSVPPREVAAKAKEHGMKLTNNYVSRIRSLAKNRPSQARPADSAAPAKRGPGRPPKTAVAPAARTDRAAPTADTDRQFLSLVLELGLRRSEDLLASVKARAASLA